MDLMDSPERNFNAKFTPSVKYSRKKGAKRVHLVSQEYGENVTVIYCDNASGNSSPPAILFKD
nr:unnamed protein product [Callosobruchus analis]